MLRVILRHFATEVPRPPGVIKLPAYLLLPDEIKRGIRQDIRTRRRGDAAAHNAWVAQFGRACAAGDEAAAMSAMRHITVSRELVSAWGFTVACGAGHLNLARALTTECGLTKKEVRGSNHAALTAASIAGHRAVKEWLLDTYYGD